MRKVKKSCADTMDGVSNNIPSHFRSICKNLYNCVQEVTRTQEEVKNKITDEALNDVKESDNKSSLEDSSFSETWQG